MLALVIKGGKLERREIAGSLESLQEIVGGYIEPFFTLPSPVGSGELTGYVNEEGLMHQLPISFGVIHAPNYIVPLAGDAVIAGLNEDGETRGLTEAEADLLTKRYGRPRLGLCPVLEGFVPESVMMVAVDGMLNLAAL